MNTAQTKIFATASSPRPIQFSLLFFSSNEAEFSEDKYQLLFEAAEFADRHGFRAVWIPERHFNAVGGLFPNPSVIAAALAVRTKNIRLRAGSLVAPLHHPVRIAEEWSVVDNLSNGRVDLAFARGWNPNDFILSPQTFSRDNALLFSQIETVRKLWRGETLEFPNAHGQQAAVRIYPLPKQPALQVWLSCFGNLERFREAASVGANILTMIFNQTLQDMGAKIELYRQLRREHGYADPGTITLMLHTLVHRDLELVKAKVRDPFLEYIKTAVNLHQQGIPEQQKTDEEKRQIAEYAYERYFRTAALFGTPESCLPVVDSAINAGINEIACQIDFGVDRPTVIEALQYLAELKDHCERPLRFSHSSPDMASKTETVRSEPQKSLAVLDRLGRGWLLQTFQGMGVFIAPGEVWEGSNLREKLQVLPNNEKPLSRVCELLAGLGILEMRGATIRTTELLSDPAFQAAQNRLTSLKARLIQTMPETAPQIANLEGCVNQYPALLQGRINPADLSIDGSLLLGRGEWREAFIFNAAMPRQTPTTQDIAVIGMAGRFPGVNSLDEFWESLLAGRDLTSDVSPERWTCKPFFSPDIRTPNTTCSRRGGFLHGIELFDPLFFGISPKEALSMDPQQRLFLQEAWTAFEDAGYSMSALAGRKIGVFLGAGSGDYVDVIEAGPGLADGFLLTGNTPSTYSGRVAHFFDLKGPCLTIDTACSSSLVAVHLACASIWTGESEMALAGGVSVLSTPKAAVVTSKTGLMSPTGVLKPFDDQADGYVIGEAANALVLKPLDAALRDGDPIHGIIKGSGINHGGKKNGMLAPSPLGQTALQTEVFKRFCIDPESISYVEAHATGTRLGDAMEVNALSASFRAFTEKKQFCAVGSLKGNVGHSGQPSGISEIIKVLLALRHGKIPPTINFVTPSQAVNWAETPFYVNSRVQPWSSEIGRPRRAAVNSIGHSGTNSFVLIQEPPALTVPTPLAQKPSLITLSAKTSEALRQRASDLAQWIALHPGSNLASVAYTLNARRTPFAFRMALVVDNLAQLSEKLLKFAREGVVEHDLIAEPFRRVASPLPIQNSVEHPDPETLLKLARAWLEGSEINWEKLFAKARTLSLPTYPFAKERFWPGKAPQSQNTGIDVPSLLIPFWRNEALRQEATDGFDGPLLVFGDNEVITQSSKNVCVVSAGSAYQTSGNRVQIRPSELEDYVRLLESLREQDSFPERVVHLWNYGDGGEPPQLTLGLESLFLFAKAVAELKQRTPVTLLHVYSTADLLSPPELACISGFLRSVQHENALFRAKTIQIVRPRPRELQLAEWIAAEFANHGNPEVRYREGLREVRGVQVASAASSRPELLRKGGTYLITGGLGGLGLVFAEHLATNYQARLVLLGRSELSNEKRRRLEKLPGAVVGYFPVDLADSSALSATLQSIKTEHGSIHGILHCAGVIEDALLSAKTLESFRKVLQPKVAGTVNLDKLTRDEPLEFFALFSSLVSLTGNLGQGDYAAANRYLDSFAEWREKWRADGLCQGRTVSINWPYWQEGGMRFPAETARLMEQLLGLRPLETPQGIAIFSASLLAPQPQVGVAGADPGKIRELIEGASGQRSTAARRGAEPAGGLAAIVERDLLNSVAALLEIDARRLEVEANFSEFGMDSRIFTELAFKLNEKYGLRLAPALLFGHASLRELAKFLVGEYPGEIAAVYRTGPIPAAAQESIRPRGPSQSANRDPIAVVGLAGIYPKAADIHAFWKLLSEGGEAISEVPGSRWDWRELHGDPAEAEGVSLSRYGGFIDDMDKFDSLFFNISPREAGWMDPRQRLFLQTVWSVLEDSGHTPQDLWNARTGLFVGVQGNDYAELLRERSTPEMAAGLSPAMIANRVSYFFNWHGPSEIIDTGCSSAAVAIHRAIQAIRGGECEQAVAGGVNLILSPRPHVLLSQLGLLSSGDRSRIYDKNGAGYLRGEGIGAVLLKPLNRALADRNPIYATVLASAQVHNGRTASIGLPNPLAQAEALLRAWREAGIDPNTVSYIEAQGTGTPNGDQAEIIGFKTAFEKWNASQQPRAPRRKFCGIGSLKPSIGHLETSSALAAFSKVALALKHKKIPATLNLPESFPELDLEESPFHLQGRTSGWESAGPRRAGVHSFGFGGTVVHLLLEEAPDCDGSVDDQEAEHLFVLSAKTESQLRVYSGRVKDWLADNHPVLRDLAYTFQTAREPMEFRLAALARTNDELRDLLGEFSRGAGNARVFTGKAQRGEAIAPESSLSGIAQAWVRGGSFDWNLKGNRFARKISAPTYPFARERHWVPPAPISGNGHANGVPANGHQNGDGADPMHEMHLLIANLLQVPPAILPLDEPLVKFGADSIFLMQLIRKLRKSFGLHVKVEDVVACGSVRGIARLVGNQDPSPARAVPTEVTAVEAHQLLSRLDELSEDEVSALLDRFEPGTERTSI